MKIRALLCLFAVLSTSCGGGGGGGSRPPPTIAELTEQHGAAPTYSATWTCPTETAYVVGSFYNDIAFRMMLNYPGLTAAGTGPCTYNEATGELSAHLVSLSSSVEIVVEGTFVYDGHPDGPYRMDGTYTCTPADGPYEHGAIMIRGPAPQGLRANAPPLRERGWIYADDGELVGTVLAR